MYSMSLLLRVAIVVGWATAMQEQCLGVSGAVRGSLTRIERCVASRLSRQDLAANLGFSAGLEMDNIRFDIDGKVSITSWLIHDKVRCRVEEAIPLTFT
jgi:hypothetical protein